MRQQLLALIERRTLAYVNRQRERVGAPTLAELPLGYRGSPRSCPLAGALPGATAAVLPHHWRPSAAERPQVLPWAPVLFVWLFDSGRAFRQYRMPGWLARLGRPVTLGEVEAARAVERDREPTAV